MTDNPTTAAGRAARFDTDDNFLLDWVANWLLYGTVYAINTSEIASRPFRSPDHP